MRSLRLASAFVLLAGVVHVLYVRQRPEPMVQAQMNLLFAERPLQVAFEKYPRLRPPLYPLALWGAARAGLRPAVVQQALLLALLAAVAALLARSVRPPLAIAAVGALALAHFNYVNAAQFTAETLFAPLAVALLLALRAYARQPAWRPLLVVAALTSLLALTRYFGLQFAVPLALGAIAWRARPWRRAAAHASALLAVALVPVGAWMWITYQQTGYLTGTDRTRVRDLPEAARHWEQLTGLDDHVLLAARTLWVDFLSPSDYAAHAVVTRPYAFSPLEWGLLALVLACTAAGVRSCLVPSPPRAGPDSPWLAPGVPEGLAFAWYLVATLAVWTVSNNDPIYTRFLFPAYGLAWIALAAAYERVATRVPRARFAWWALFAAFVVLQAARSWRAVALPVRYF